MTEALVTAALRNLETGYPHLYFWTDLVWEDTRVWFAQGRNGSPWLVMSDDLERFRTWLIRA
jgi:hypothetical protein